MAERKYDKISAIARRRGFFWPSSELYGGLAGFYDYGPIGALLKQNIEKVWKKIFIAQEGMLLLDTPNVMADSVFQASGHLEHFADPLVTCTDCNTNFRADKLVEEKLKIKTEAMGVDELNGAIIANGVACPKCKGKLGEVYKFNLMFGTEVGPGEEKRIAYLRPETAQGAFVSFERLWEVARKKLPFGAALVGRSYRNEISPRQGMIRLREFSQAEAEVFFNPSDKKHPCFKEVEKEELNLLTIEEQKKGKSEKGEKFTAKEAVHKKIIKSELQAYYLTLAKQFFNRIGFPDSSMRCRQQLSEERAHYSIDTWDIEIHSEDFGWIEVAAIADRADYDLKRHSETAKKDLSVTIDGKKFLPHVMEASFGIDRPFYLLLEHSLKAEGKRTLFKFKKKVAPFEAAVFPLVDKDKLPEKALDIYNMLLENNVMAQYDNSGNIGKMYARADEIGIPICVTIDHQTLKDDTVTVRYRDTTKQKRVHVKKNYEILHEIWEKD
ncbi:TPA: glycine--tRNA ligase [archaeon]|uniref:glycine--tRNA ligase n=1 Tax=Candidatus Naiadarchaeum limnaeum TaxID=2756139 RepID=A0A832XGB8_9ARCH|nr:glycine--tRNA ligase [Candidatus Naiadarchaeum limnaeum]